jgi:hypothetical protein
MLDTIHGMLLMQYLQQHNTGSALNLMRSMASSQLFLSRCEMQRTVTRQHYSTASPYCHVLYCTVITLSERLLQCCCFAVCSHAMLLAQSSTNAVYIVTPLALCVVTRCIVIQYAIQCVADNLHD